MMRFSVCIETIFTELPLHERIEQSAACGAVAVEFWTWRDKDPDEIARAKEAAGVDVAAFAALGEHRPNDPAAADETAAELLDAIEAARQIGATGLIVRTEHTLEDVARERQLDALVSLLTVAAPAAQKAHATLLVEPLNRRADHPGALLSTTADALEVVDAVGQPNVKMLFNVYHQYVTEGAVLASIEGGIGRIGHVQVADVPGRGEPGTGALDFEEILGLVDSLDYDGFIGLEFFPSGDHAAAVRSMIELA